MLLRQVGARRKREGARHTAHPVSKDAPGSDTRKTLRDKRKKARGQCNMMPDAREAAWFSDDTAALANVFRSYARTLHRSENITKRNAG
jgi:hypothetical protein